MAVSGWFTDDCSAEGYKGATRGRGRHYLLHVVNVSASSLEYISANAKISGNLELSICFCFEKKGTRCPVFLRVLCGYRGYFGGYRPVWVPGGSRSVPAIFFSAGTFFSFFFMLLCKGSRYFSYLRFIEGFS